MDPSHRGLSAGAHVLVRVCVPYRPDLGHRDRVWAMCEARWRILLPGVEIVTGADESEPMNRSRWRNLAAVGDWEFAVFADADIMVSMPEQITFAVEAASRTGFLTYAHEWRAQLSETGTTQVLLGTDPCRAEIEAWDPHTFSGCYVVPRGLWEQVGGFDERFVGWGWEDLAFMRACGAIGGGLGRAPGVIYHCWHPQEHGDGVGNEELWRAYERAGWAAHRMRQVISR